MSEIELRSATGRWIVAATVLGSAVVSLDATVVNIALPTIGRKLHADVAALQWVASGYALTLASFILLGGSLGDRLGRRKVFVWGTIAFAAASLLCGIAPNIETLIAARVVQGVAGALLTPGSLALISSSIARRDQGAAIGLWSGLGGVAGAVGPLLGGYLVEAAGWRSVFLINLPLAAVVVAVSLVHVPESRDVHAAERLDLPGTLVVAAALGTLTYGLIGRNTVLSVVGVMLMLAFVVIERRSRSPLVPPSLFASRVFTAANLATFTIYAAFGGVFFLLPLQLQLVAGYSPLRAGVSTIPITMIMLVLSASAGRWAQQHGPRIPMTIGPLLAAVGLALLIRIGRHANYFTDVLPGVLVFGLGLAALVAPLTGAVLGAAPTEDAGIASGVNNAVARTASLLAVASIPGLAGISGYADTAVFSAGFRHAVWICVGLLLLGSAVAAVLLGERRGAPQLDAIDCCPNCGVTGPAVAPRT